MPTPVLPPPPSGPLGEPASEQPVRDLASPGVVMLPEDATVEQVARAMLAHRVHAVLIVGSGGAALGWATARNVLTVEQPGIAWARDAIVEPPVTIHPSAPISDAAALIGRQDVGRVLVGEPGELPSGVVTDLDLLRMVAR